MTTNIMLIVGLLLVVLLFLYVYRFRHHDPKEFSPSAAWSRAAIYCCFCVLVAGFSGCLSAVLNSEIATPDQLSDSAWRYWTIFCFAWVGFAYWGIWGRYTVRFDRKLDIPAQSFFGLCWGISSGLLFLSFWHIALFVGEQWQTWQVWLLAYVQISIWQWLWQDYYWDVYVSPEHDTPLSIKIKVPCTHIPNVTLCLIYFSLYENYWIFIALQTLALVGASIFMRMPAPWSRESTPVATPHPGILGFPRGGGYISEDAANDPYLKAAHLPR